MKMVDMSSDHIMQNTIIGRQGLEGPPTKVILLWLGAYICIWLGIWLSGYISMSHHRVPTSFSQCLVLSPLQQPCQKDQQDVLTHNCLPPLLALCSQARMYEINYIDMQSQDKNRCGQLAVDIRHSAFTPSTANTFFDSSVFCGKIRESLLLVRWLLWRTKHALPASCSSRLLLLLCSLVSTIYSI